MNQRIRILLLTALVMQLASRSHAGTPTLLEVPAGSFTMGDGVALCASGIREVTLTRNFTLGVREVTNLEYLEALQWAYDEGRVDVIAGEVRDQRGSNVLILEMNTGFAEITFSAGVFGLRQAPMALLNAYPGGYDPSLHPVKRITWYGAAAYCDWMNARDGLPEAYDPLTWVCNGGDPYSALGYRLPTDAEWERAAKYDDGRAHPWGNDAPDCDLANSAISGLCRGWTEPVETHPAGVSALGFQDLGGNVGEWCNDWHDCDLPSGTFTDPTGPVTGVKKVAHGGGWFYGPIYTRCSNRDADPPAYPYEAAGIRLARTVMTPAGVEVVEANPSLRAFPSVVRAGQPLHVDFQDSQSRTGPQNGRAGDLGIDAGDAVAQRSLHAFLEVLSVTGRKIASIPMGASASTLVPTAGWPSGIYYLRAVTAGPRTTATVRVVVVG